MLNRHALGRPVEPDVYITYAKFEDPDTFLEFLVAP